jgi:hypothetical protein
MPLKNGRISIEVSCSCGCKTSVQSGTYGSYCLSCGRPIFSSEFRDDFNEEIRAVVKAEKLKIRHSTKTLPDLSVGSSLILSNCEICGGPLDPSQLFIVDGAVACKKCFEHLPTCKNCGETHLKTNLKNGLCEGCAISFKKCPTCGNVYDIRKYKTVILDEKEYCDSCLGTYLGAHNIHFQQYSYKPTPCFFGDKETANGRFFGVELEMDNSPRRKEFMALSYCEEIYYKPDGSLSCGVEVVTHPATLEYHMRELPWDRILSAAKRCGFKSHTGTSGDGSGASPTCGLHIHVSKEAFGQTTAKRDSNEAKILVLFDKFWPQLAVFSRRDPRSLERWAKHYANFDVSNDQMTDIIKRAKGECGKYSAVNLGANSGATVEFRLFRGTTNKETILASIQLLDLMFDAMALPTKRVHTMTWDEFILSGEKYAEFTNYIARLRGMSRNKGKI